MERSLDTPAPDESFARNPVTPLDLLVAVGGLGILVGLGLEWVSGSGASGYGDISVLRILLIIVGLAGLALPVVLGVTRKSDVPVVWEGFLAPVSSILFLILGLKLLFPPEGGAGSGMFVVGAAVFVLTAACWKTLSRER